MNKADLVEHILDESDPVHGFPDVHKLYLSHFPWVMELSRELGIPVKAKLALGESHCFCGHFTVEVSRDAAKRHGTFSLFFSDSPEELNKCIRTNNAPEHYLTRPLARLSQFLTRNPRKWLILSTRYGANGLRLSPQIDFDRGRFGVVVALVKTSRDDGGSVEPALRVE